MPQFENKFLRHALQDLNPRHLVLETSVLPTELKAFLTKLLITFCTLFHTFSEACLTFALQIFALCTFGGR